MGSQVIFEPDYNFEFTSSFEFFATPLRLFGGFRKERRIHIGWDSAHPEIGKFGRDRGARKILPESYG